MDCQKNEYLDLSLEACIKCNAACQTCYDKTNSGCYNCSENYEWEKTSSTCISNNYYSCNYLILILGILALLILIGLVTKIIIIFLQHCCKKFKSTVRKLRILQVANPDKNNQLGTLEKPSVVSLLDIKIDEKEIPEDNIVQTACKNKSNEWESTKQFTELSFYTGLKTISPLKQQSIRNIEFESIQQLSSTLIYKIQFQELMDNNNPIQFDYQKVTLKKKDYEDKFLESYEAVLFNKLQVKILKQQYQHLMPLYLKNFLKIDKILFQNNKFFQKLIGIAQYENIFVGFCEESSQMNLVQFKKDKKYFSNQNLKTFITKQLIKSIFLLHQFGVTHNDLRPENIYINFKEDNENKPTVKISLSFQFLAQYNNSEVVVSEITDFSSPEQVQQYYSDNKIELNMKKSDVWSLGMLVNYLFLKKLIQFKWNQLTDPKQIINEIQKQQFQKKAYKNNSCKIKWVKELLKATLNIDPNKRFRMSKIALTFFPYLTNKT